MVPEPGVYRVPAEEYHSWDAMSKSRLKHWTRSMALVKDPPKREPTREMILGTWFHAMILEPDEFAAKARVGPDADRNTKEWKSWASEQPDGSWLIKAGEFANLTAARHSVLTHEYAGKLLGGKGEPEISLVWDDPKSGVRCKCRVDRLTPAGGVELKTTGNAHWSKFQWTAADMGYYLGAELYARGVGTRFNWPKPPYFWVVAAELEYPFGVMVYRLESVWASEEVDCALRRVDECQKSGVWPVYPSGVFPLPEMRKRFVGDSSEGGSW